MVNKFWHISLLLCMTWSGWAEAGLTVKVDKKMTVFGEPLLVEIKADNASVALSSINLDRLKQSFDVFGLSSSTQVQTKKGRHTTTETMTLTLYPLRKGRLELPELKYMNMSSRPLTVSVLESSTQTPLVIFKTALDAAQPQVRQAVTLSLEIYDDGRLQWAVPRELRAANLHQRKLAESQRDELVDGVRYTVHRYAWSIMPLREGQMSVEFPMLEAYKFGTRLRYSVASLRLNAAPVPAYLPVHVPVGKLLVEVEALPQEVALDRPVNRVFTVQSAGVSEEGLGKLLSTISSNEAFRFYPARISTAETGRATSATEIFQVTLPFVPLHTGTLQLPEINLPYYDPASARLESVLIPGVAVEVYSPFWRTAKMLALVLAGLIAIAGLAYWSYKKLRRMQKVRKALAAISNAKRAEEMRHALINFDADIHALTLQQWLLHMQLAYVVDERLDGIVKNLMRSQYGADETDTGVPVLAAEAAQLLGNLSVRKEVMGKTSLQNLYAGMFQPR